MRYGLTILWIGLMTIVGCSSTQETKTLVSFSSNSINATADGISVINIKIEPKGEILSETLNLFGQPIAKQLHSKLLQEGIFVRRVSTVDIPAIVASIGEIIEESSVWHGQIFKWRDLHQRRIEPQGMLISEQGISYFIQEGYLSLLGRSWLLEREDGLHLYLQFLPTWHVPQQQSNFVGQSNEPLRSKVFKNLEFETLLQDGEAIIVATHLFAPKVKLGPQDEGPPAVRLGEALLGGPAKKDIVQFLVIEANIMPRG